MEKTVIELFAGVGGFRVGFNHITALHGTGRAVEENRFNFVWANQWEPSTKIQPAFDCYIKRFGESDSHINKDVAKVNTNDIPNHSILVGGFPCQDYSVARSLSGEKGIEGKKGVLFWEIIRIIKDKNTPFLFLENVDRLLKSPSKQRGRDFGIMLRALNDLGYLVEWRIINAADYGHPQRRRRIFIFAAKKDTEYYKIISLHTKSGIIQTHGILAKAFPVESMANEIESTVNQGFPDLVKLSNNFRFAFHNAGVLIDGVFLTGNVESIKLETFKLATLLEKDVTDEHFYLTDSQIKKFEYLKGAKKVPRISATGLTYNYSEGGMAFPDDLNLPARTMLTSERSLNRSTHVIKDPITKRLRNLTPVECERINEFPSGWTDSGMSLNQRYFMMGNALVCGAVGKVGDELHKLLDNEK